MTIKGRKTLHNTDASGATQNVPDIEFYGNGDLFQLLAKASSENEGWMKSTKAMEVPGGVVIQTTTQQRNPDGSYSLTDALCYVPAACIFVSADGTRELAPRVFFESVHKEEKAQ